MKKLIIILQLLMACIVSNAQQFKFSADNLTINRGEIKALNISLDNSIDIVSFQFDICVPEGIIVIDENDDDYAPEYTERTKKYVFSVGAQEEGKAYRVIAYHNSNKVTAPGNGTVVTLYLKANESAPIGEYSPAIKNALVTDASNASIQIDDNTTWNCTVCGKYSRTTTSGNYGTICLPWNVKLSDVKGAEIYSINGKVMSGANPSSIIAEAVEDELVAGVPYIFKATADKITATYSTEPVSIAGSSNGLVGTFTDLNNIAGKYVIANNKIGKCAAGSKCSANRAYIDMDQVVLYNASEVSGKRLVTIGVGDDATAIDGVEAVDSEYEVYSVSGIRMNAEAKGINILKSKQGTKKIMK